MVATVTVNYPRLALLMDAQTVCGTVHTNVVEGYFSVFKRGTESIYQHCGELHSHRYLGATFSSGSFWRLVIAFLKLTLARLRGAVGLGRD